MATAKKATAKKAVKKVVKKTAAIATGIVHVGHFDGELQNVEVKSTESVEEAFKRVGINLNEYKDVEINTLNAEVIKKDAKVKPGTTYLLTGNYDNGA